MQSSEAVAEAQEHDFAEHEEPGTEGRKPKARPEEETRDENFLGSGWTFVQSKSGNFWRHRSGKVVMASSTW